MKESKHNGDYEAKPSAVFDRVVAALDASFHESDEAKAMKARAKYDNLETAFQEFQVSWLEALTELNAAGVYKCQKDLLYDYLPLRKIGSFLREEVSRDLRFWPLRPSPGVQQEFRSVENWSEAALVAREITLRKDANKALETHHTSTEARQPKGPKNAKNQGGGSSDATRAQVSLPSSGNGEKCKRCSNPGRCARGRQLRSAENARGFSLNSRGQVLRLRATSAPLWASRMGLTGLATTRWRRQISMPQAVETPTPTRTTERARGKGEVKVAAKGRAEALPLLESALRAGCSLKDGARMATRASLLM